MLCAHMNKQTYIYICVGVRLNFLRMFLWIPFLRRIKLLDKICPTCYQPMVLAKVIDTVHNDQAIKSILTHMSRLFTS